MISCPVCNHHSTLYLSTRDFMVTQEEFNIYKCKNCTFLFTQPVPSDISRYYQSTEYLSHHSDATNLISLLYNKVRNQQLEYKLSLIQTYASGNHLLDYGCGTGSFLKHSKDNGYHISGLEVDNDARTIAESITSQHIFSDQNDLPADASFDIITLWHVLEHLSDPLAKLKYFQSCLNVGGILVLALPNFHSWDADHYSEYWAAYDVPRHLFHFSRSSIHKMAAQTNFSVNGIHPLKYDAFYVSLLSEQYKGRSIMRYPFAFINGLRSNFYARTSGEYSSLVYILQKSND